MPNFLWKKSIYCWHLISTNKLVTFRFDSANQPSTWILKICKNLTLRLPTISRNFMMPFKLSSELVDVILECCLIENWSEFAVWNTDILFNTLDNLKTFSIVNNWFFFIQELRRCQVSASVMSKNFFLFERGKHFFFYFLLVALWQKNNHQMIFSWTVGIFKIRIFIKQAVALRLFDKGWYVVDMYPLI